MPISRQRPRPALILAVLLTAATVSVVGPAPAAAAQFEGGPFVRVTPNQQVVLEWRTDVAWFGRVEVFRSFDGTDLRMTKQSEDAGGNPIAATHHLVTIPVGPVLAANTTYYFRVTAMDPSKVNADITSPMPLPSFFTGTQAVTEVRVVPLASTAEISWDANVIGIGRVTISPAAADGRTTFDDGMNEVNHSISVANLGPATTYTFTVATVHAESGATLASQAGMFRSEPLNSPCGLGIVCIRAESVQVTPNVQVEIEWRTLVAWFGRVDVFSTPDGADGPVFTQWATDQGGNTIGAQNQTVVLPVAGPITPDTTLYFRITTQDPGDPLSQQVSAIHPFFTGEQTLSDVDVLPDVSGAEISWDANVIGYGQVEYGTSPGYGQTLSDAAIATDHSFVLSGLQPTTTYYYRLSNLHAASGVSLASTTGTFTTPSLFEDAFLAPLNQSSDPASPVLNTGKNGRVIPVKVRIGQGTVTITDQNAPGPITIGVSKLVSCSNVVGSDPLESYADAGQSSAGTNGFRYDWTAQAWTYGLDTRALGLVTGNCYRIDVWVAGTPVTNAFAVYQPTR